MRTITITAMLSFCTGIGAQVAISRTSLVQQHHILTKAMDTTPGGVNIAVAGTAKTWDFTALNAHTKETWRFTKSDWLDGSQYWPGANIAYQRIGVDTANAFLSISDSEVRFLGSYFNDGEAMVFAPLVQKLLNLPGTYNSTYNNDSSKNVQQANYLGIDPDDSGPIPTIDSFRPVISLYTSSILDGYGTVKTPLGTFPCLKQTLTQIRKFDIHLFASGFWFPAPKTVLDMMGFPNPWDTSYRHLWWTNDSSAGFPLVEYSFVNGDTKATNVEWLQTKPQATGIPDVETNDDIVLYPNPASESVSIYFGGSMQNVPIDIYDIHGKKCLHSVLPNEGKINISCLPNGLYTAIIQKEDGVVYRRLLKQ